MAKENSFFFAFPSAAYLIKGSDLFSITLL